MRRILACLGLVIMCGSVSTLLAQQPGTAILGSWRVVEVSGGAEGSNAHPQPGLFMFTGKHYSIMRVTGVKPRPKFASNNVATGPEKIASYDGLFAQSGTYEVSGSTVITRPIVAKAEFPMTGSPAKAQIKMEGDTLWWTFAGGQTVKLTRVD